MKTKVLTLLTLAVVGAAAPARADDGAPAPAQRWYGGPILLADAAAIGLAYLAVAGPDKFLVLLLAEASFVLTPPIIHASYGHADRAPLSGILRLALPLAGGLVASAAFPCAQTNSFLDFCDIGRFSGGFLAGVVAAIITDQFRASDTRPAVATRPPKRPLVTVAPYAFPLARGAAIGLAGRY
jgi:hypothetical protein